MKESIFDHFPILETRRLILGEIKEEHAQRIFEMRRNGRVNEHIARPPIKDENTALEIVKKCKELFEHKGGIAWAGIDKENGQFIGSCGFNRIEKWNNRAEIGGELMVEYWGKRISFEAVKEIIHFGLNQLELNAIEAKVISTNKSAIFVLEKLGFEKEAHFKKFIPNEGNPLDLCVYVLHRDIIDKK